MEPRRAFPQLRRRPKDIAEVDTKRPELGSDRDGKEKADLLTFIYNTRFLLFAIPNIILALYIGGRIMLSLAILAATTTYLLYNLKLHDYVVGSIWLFSGIMYVAQIIYGGYLFDFSIMNLFFLLGNGFFIFVFGAWITLQLKWVYGRESFAMVERLVLSFTAIPFVSTVTWWLIQHVGIGASPYIYFVASALAYYGLQLPQVSSLSDERNKSHNDADTTENKKSNDGVPHDEAAEKYLAELSAGSRYISSPWEGGFHTIHLLIGSALLYIFVYHRVLFTFKHFMGLTLLLGLPIVFLLIVNTKKPLWWLGFTEDVASTVLYYPALFATIWSATSASLLLIFYSSLTAEMLYIRYHPYWSLALTLLSTLSLLLGLGLHFKIGAATSLIHPMLSSSKFFFHALATPPTMFATFLLGFPWYLYPLPITAAFFLVNFYLHKHLKDYLFFAGTSAICTMTYTQMRFWFIDYKFFTMDLSMQFASLLLVLIVGVSLLLPAFILMNRWTEMNSFLAFVYALFFTFAEVIVYYQGVYSEWLVVITSLLGTYVTIKLYKSTKITENMAALILGLYLGKITLVAFPHYYDDWNKTWQPFLSAMFFTPLSKLFYFKPVNDNISAKQYLLYLIGLTTSALLLQPVLSQFLTEQWQSPAMEVSLNWLVLGIALLPLSFKFRNKSVFVRNLNILLLVSSGLLMLIHGLVNQDYDQNSTSWLPFVQLLQLFLALLVPILILTRVLPVQRSGLMRLLVASVEGVLIGTLIMNWLNVRSHATLFWLGYITMGQLFCVFALFSIWPSPRTVDRMPTIYALLCSSFAFIYLLNDIYASKRDAEAYQLVLFGTFMAMNGGISLILKLQTSQFSNQKRRPASTKEAKSGNETSWRHSVGNLSTVVCLQLLVHLTTHYFDGSQLVVMFLSSLLVLLHSEQAPVSQLSAKNRYYPIILYNTVYMLTSALAMVLFSRPFFNYTGYFHAQPSINYTTRVAWKNLLLAIGVIPSAIFANLFLHSWKQRSILAWLLVLPLDLIALLLADIAQLQFVSLFAMGTCIYQFIDARNNRKRNSRAI